MGAKQAFSVHFCPYKLRSKEMQKRSRFHHLPLAFHRTIKATHSAAEICLRREREKQSTQMNLSKPNLSKLAQGILNISFHFCNKCVNGDKIPKEGNHNLCTPAPFPPSFGGWGGGEGGGGGGDDYTQDRKSKRRKPEIIWDYRNKILWAFSVEIPDANTGWEVFHRGKRRADVFTQFLRYW